MVIDTSLPFSLQCSYYLNVAGLVSREQMFKLKDSNPNLVTPGAGIRGIKKSFHVKTFADFLRACQS